MKDFPSPTSVTTIHNCIVETFAGVIMNALGARNTATETVLMCRIACQWLSMCSSH